MYAIRSYYGRCIARPVGDRERHIVERLAPELDTGDVLKTQDRAVVVGADVV